MKIFRKILMIIVNILLLPCALLMTAGAVWYTVPSIAATKLGLWLISIISERAIFWITIGSASLFVLLGILHIIFSKDLSAKFKNFFVHLTTWLMCLFAIALTIYAFVVSNVIAKEVIISNLRKIGIAGTLIALILAIGFSGKIHSIINRKIQSYDTAREMNKIGRSSIIVANLLKLFEVLFPEILVLLLLCFCVSWNVATYFIIVIVAAFIPVIGNIICDFTTRAEIRRKSEAEHTAK